MNLKNKAYLSIGSNLGDKIENLQNTINFLRIEVGTVKKISSIYETPAWGFDGNDFYNICIEIETELIPEVLLTTILNIEKKLGRQRSIDKQYQNRTVDIDIILYNSTIINTDSLIIPHPKSLSRNFVLRPLSEISPDSVFTNTNQTFKECNDACDDKSSVRIVPNKTLI